MPLASFHDLMTDAERGRYAVGYFESWNLESLLAVADAAETMRSPVILGFSGIYLPHAKRRVRDRLEPYAAMGLEVCRGLSVPACLLFNESPHMSWVNAALDAGFNLVMFCDDRLSAGQRMAEIRDLVGRGHRLGAAVEAELEALAGVGGDLAAADGPEHAQLTDPDEARIFVQRTGVDALAVNCGQVHLHGRRTVRLDFDVLRRLGDIGIPLVLHGASSVDPADLHAAADHGVRKINVGSRLKQAYFEALRAACAEVIASTNPYEVLGSGLDADVLVAGRIAMQREVERFMALFGSAGKADTAEQSPR